MGADGLDLHQFLASGHHHLGHLLEADLQFSKGLLRIAIGTVLNTGSLLTTALNQGFTLLLRLLTELKGIVVNPFRFVTAFLLETQPLPADRLEILQSLLTVGFVLLGVLALDLRSLLLELLTTLQPLLFQLLPAGCELLLLLCRLRLHLLLELGVLLACVLKNLLTLLAGLFAQFVHLTLRLLSDRGIVHQLFTLALSLLNDLLRLLTGRVDELIAAVEQLSGPLHLLGHRLADGIKHLDRIPFIDKPATGEGKATSLQHDFFQLIELIEDGEPGVTHVTGGVKAELKCLFRSDATSQGTMCSTGPPKRATSLTTELLRKLCRADVARKTVSRSSASERFVWAI